MTSVNTETNTVQLPSGPESTGASTANKLRDQEAARQALAAQLQKAAKAAERAPSPEEVQQAAAELSDYLAVASRALNIRVDQDLERPVVTVLDADTEEVVRQIPSEEAVAVARYIRSQRDSTDQQIALAGVILNEQG